MCRLILTIAAVIAIAQLSKQASLSPNDEQLKYSFKNFNPHDAQSLDIKVVSESNQSNMNKRTLPVSELNSPRIIVENWPNHSTGYVNLTASNYADSEICFLNPTFCCRFEIYWQNVSIGVNSQHYFYYFGIFQGWTNITTPPMLCSVFRCATDDLQNCDQNITVNTNIVFDNITITANITKHQEYLLEPYSFTSNMLPIDSSNYEWHEFEENDYYGVKYILNTTHTNLYAFSINGTGNGTNNGGGGGDGDGDGAAGLAVSMFMMLCIFLFTFLV